MCTAEAASKGDHYSQSILKYAFHEVSRETLKEASSKFSDLAIFSLCIGFSEGSLVFGSASTACDFILIIDNLITDLRNSETRTDYFNAVKRSIIDSGIIIAGLTFSSLTKSGANKISTGITVKVGSSGRYYELGHRGAISSKEEFRKELIKDITSGYFGQDVIPNSPSIVQEAMKVYDAVKGTCNEK